MTHPQFFIAQPPLYFMTGPLRTAKRYVTWLVSNHDRRIMSENSGVYIAMKSAVILHNCEILHSVRGLYEKNSAS